jgi:predicted DCC family thiol-disulfide oxidoreductase YuxK
MTPRRNWHSVPAEDLPDRMILFDGVCVLCSRWVAFVIAHDPGARYRFVAIQTPRGRQLAERFGIDAENPETNVIVSGGRAYFKLESALVALADFPGWRWTRIAYLLPKRVRDFLYDRIARNRYRLFGRRATCLVPTPDVASRFLPDIGVEASGGAEPS